MTVQLELPTGPSEAGVRTGRSAWRLTIAFGVLFIACGLIVLLALVPKAFRDGDAEGRLAAPLVGTVFSVAGAGIVALGIHERRRLRERAALVQLHPEAPWMWDPDWARAESRGSGTASAVVAWTFAFFWNALTWPVLPRALAAARWDEPTAWALLLFPAAALGLLAWALAASWHQLRFGSAVLELTTLPGVIGGRLEGVVQLARPFLPEGGFSAQLDCVREGRDDSGSESILWQERVQILASAVQRGPRGSAVPIRFEIPWGEAPTCDAGRGGQAIFWRLTLGAAAPGIDLRTHFTVPVFVTAASDPAARRSGQPALAVRPAAELAPAFAGSRIRAARSPDGGLVLELPPARNPRVAVTVTLLAAAWTAMTWLLGALGAPAFFLIVFGLCDALLVLASLELWTGSTRLHATRRDLAVHRGSLGIGWTRRIDASEVTAIDLSVGMQAGHRVFYRLVARRRNGRPLGCGGGIADKRQAEALAAALAEAIGLPAPPDCCLPLSS